MSSTIDPFDPAGTGYVNYNVSPNANKLMHGIGGSLLFRESNGRLMFADRLWVASDKGFYLDLFVPWTSGKDLDICVWFSVQNSDPRISPDPITSENTPIGWQHGSNATVVCNNATSYAFWTSGDNTDYNGFEHVSFYISPDVCTDVNVPSAQASVKIHVAGNYYEEAGGAVTATLSDGTQNSVAKSWTPRADNLHHRAELDDPEVVFNLALVRSIPAGTTTPVTAIRNMW